MTVPLILTIVFVVLAMLACRAAANDFKNLK